MCTEIEKLGVKFVLGKERCDEYGFGHVGSEPGVSRK